jgi:hypothetical protein
MTTPMMKCGHAANATDQEGKPCCVICAGIDPGYNQIVQSPDLTGRMAKCSYYGSIPSGRNHSSNYGCEYGKPCLCKQPSSTDLPFFTQHPDREFDEFYCGCWGWD